MRFYMTNSPVRISGVRYEINDLIELDDRTGKDFVARGIVDLAEDEEDADPPASPPAAAKAALPSKTELAKFNKQELLDQAKAEGVQVEEGATNKAILGTILAARPQS